jgi:replication-associated recombination protein RarA
MRRELTTVRGYSLPDVASALQKAIRRADGRIAGYFAIELFESGFAAYAWRRLLTISAEDCVELVTQEVTALRDAQLGAGKGRGRVFLAKAVLVLCQCGKSRDADHLTNLVYDRRAVDEALLERELAEARQDVAAIPDYAFDCHTAEGRRRGKTKREFFVTEHDALRPRVPGLFDDDVEALRKEENR